MTFDLSKKEAINLNDEIIYLKSYFELQRIRLNILLDYCIDLSFDLTTSKIYIPSLLIQPIVENAILHGIVPSKNKEEFTLRWKTTVSGWKAPKKQKLKSKNHHKSLGNKILRERLDILNYNEREKITFSLGNLDVEGGDFGLW